MTVYECTILGLCKRTATGRLGGPLVELSSSHNDYISDRSDFGGKFLQYLSRLCFSK